MPPYPNRERAMIWKLNFAGRLTNLWTLKKYHYDVTGSPHCDDVINERQHGVLYSKWRKKVTKNHKWRHKMTSWRQIILKFSGIVYFDKIKILWKFQVISAKIRKIRPFSKILKLMGIFQLASTKYRYLNFFAWRDRKNWPKCGQ